MQPPFGNLIEVIDAAGNHSRMTYDLRGRKVVQEDPDLGRWEYRYNPFGELIPDFPLAPNS